MSEIQKRHFDILNELSSWSLIKIAEPANNFLDDDIQP